MTEKICFPLHQGLPPGYNPPTLDGYCEWEIGVPAPTIEPGWTGATRIAYAGAGGAPAMSFQGLKDKNQPYIYLSFVARSDPQFDSNDGIIVIIQDPNDPTNKRIRLLVQPVDNNGQPLDPAPWPTNSISVGVDVYTSQALTDFAAPFDINIWDDTNQKWGASLKTSLTCEVKSRAWKVNRKTYSDTTHTTLVSETIDFNWSVEIKLPTTIPMGVAGNLVLDPGPFGLYYLVIKILQCPVTSPNILTCSATEFAWPSGGVIVNPQQGRFSSLADIVPPSFNDPYMGEASIGNNCQGVRFDHQAGALQVQLPNGSVGTNLDGQVGAENLLIANILGPANTPNINAEFRLANFGIGPGGQLTLTTSSWDPIDPQHGTDPTHTLNNPTDPQNIPASGKLTLNKKWTISQADNTRYQMLSRDQCLWVLLDSNPPSGQTVVFAESSYRQNLYFYLLSSIEKQVVISGKDHCTPPDGAADHDFLLVTCHRLMASTQDYDGWQGRKPAGEPPDERRREQWQAAREMKQGEGQDKISQWGKTTSWLAKEIFKQWAKSKDVVYTWLSITTGYRRTGKILTLGSITYQLYEPIDSFGYVLFHEGQVKNFKNSLGGPGLLEVSPGVYKLRVPDEGEVVLKARYEAIKSPEWWWWFWALIGFAIKAIRALLGKPSP